MRHGMPPAIAGGLLALLAGAPAEATGAMAVDDASLADWGSVTVEAYTQLGGGLSRWVQPAVQLAPNFQLTLGAGLDGDGAFVQGLAVQGKAMLKPPGDEGVGVALSVGTTLAPSTAGWLRGLALNVPVSEAIGPALRLHQNLGVALDPDVGAALTWGLAGELALSPALSALAEIYGQTGGATSVQAGLAYWLTPDAWQVDGEVQVSPGAGGLLLSVGMTFVGPWSGGPARP